MEAWSAVEKTAFERDQASEQLWRLAFSEPSAEALLSFDILARTGGADEIQGTSVDTAAQALEPGVTGVAHRTPLACDAMLWRRDLFLPDAGQSMA